MAFSILKSTPAQKKYTTVGCGGCDKYELCFCIIENSRSGYIWIASDCCMQARQNRFYFSADSLLHQLILQILLMPQEILWILPPCRSSHSCQTYWKPIEIRRTCSVLIAAVLVFFLTSELFGASQSGSNFIERKL